MTTAKATFLLAKAQGWVLVHRARIGLKENRLLTLTIATFLLVYAVAAYVLVGRGIEFIHRLPLLGPLLTERLVYLLFFFFFVMLIISNATITGMGLVSPEGHRVAGGAANPIPESRASGKRWRA
jgi:ABC-2 type transport system permease protein